MTLSAAPAFADSCPNAQFRTGYSANLPDCRAYELVSPADTAGISPSGQTPAGALNHTVAPDGDAVAFFTDGGDLPGTQGNGYLDLYRASRSSTGWSTSYVGLTASQSELPDFLNISAQLDLSFWTPDSPLGPSEVDRGSLALPSPPASNGGDYVRNPNGLVGFISQGSLASSPDGCPLAIAPDSSHYVFGTFNSAIGSCLHGNSLPATQLEPDAPASGTGAIYDRVPGGATRTISLLPGNLIPPTSDDVSFLGASRDASAVAFSFDSTNGYPFFPTFYVRRDGVSYGVPDLVVDQALTCRGGPTSATLDYQWLRNGSLIAGATSATYTATSADAGALLQCQVTAGNADGTTVATGPPMVVAPYPGSELPPQNVPAITGTPASGSLLTCNPGAWQNVPVISYQWYRGGSPIAGENASTYAVVSADIADAIQCRVTGTNLGGSAVEFSAPLVIAAQSPTSSAAPAISNTTDPGNQPNAGDQLSCSPGTWVDSPSFSYAWLSDGSPISGATNSTYTVAASDAGTVLQCVVSASNAAATAQAASPGVVANPQPGTAPPVLTTAGTVTGTQAVGSTLTCNPGSWTGSPTFSRQWIRNGSPVAGATGTTYTLAAADRETTIQCQVTATNPGGTAAELDASASGARYINPSPPAASGAMSPNESKAYAGLSADGTYLFYLRAGDLYRFNLETQHTDQITDSGDVTVVDISADGSHAYFVSPSQLDGVKGTVGADNLYVWAGSTQFVATLSPADFATSQPSLGQYLGSLSTKTSAGRRVIGNPSLLAARTTPSGDTLVFESQAQLTSYDNSGHIEVYRYDSTSATLTCVSCNPSGAPAVSDAHLLTLPEFSSGGVGAVDTKADIPNVTADGNVVVFETGDALVPQDSNGARDVYEWEADGSRTCHTSGGCVALLSSGTSPFDSFVYGMSADGHDIFIATSQPLVPDDNNVGAQEIYDVRVDGGLASQHEASGSDCSGEACKGAPTSAPSPPLAASVSFSGPGNTQPGTVAGKPRVLTRTVRGASFLVTVDVVGQGRITITGSGIRKVARNVTRAGSYRMMVRLIAGRKRLLAHSHQLRLRLLVSYAPSGARAQTAAVRLTVRPALPRRATHPRIADIHDPWSAR